MYEESYIDECCENCIFIDINSYQEYCCKHEPLAEELGIFGVVDSGGICEYYEKTN